MTNVENILRFAMRMEKDAEDFYSYYQDKVSSPEIKNLFKELVATEKSHYEALSKKYDQMGFKEPPIAMSWVVDNRFAAKDPHVLADNSDELSGSEDSLFDVSVIRMAYLIESDFEMYYKKASESVQETEAKELLVKLSEWESRHKDTFFNKYISLMHRHFGF